MSGHSKWSTIKRDKSANDAKRGAMFTKLANAITVAVRQGRGLALALEKAKAANMPKESIQRAIDRGEGKLTSQQLVEAVFEGFGPGGVAIIVETISDNNTRTAQKLHSVFADHGGRLGTPGSVSYLFSRVGVIEIAKDGKNFDEVFAQAVEAGAEDVEETEESFLVYTKAEELHRVAEKLGAQGKLIYRPNKETIVNLTTEDHEKLQELLEAIEELDDVQEVYCNVIF